MTQQQTLVFDCPHCDEIFAETKEPDVDIHSGATYRCASCDGKVVFVALTVQQYIDHANRRTDCHSCKPNPCNSKTSTTNDIQQEGEET